MKQAEKIRTRGIQAVILTAALLAGAGCQRQQQSQPQARTDQQIASDIQAKIAAESALNGQPIQVSVSNGVATLSGNANDEASRALAANDAGSVDGVKTVINNLTVAPPPQPQQAAVPAPERKPEPDRKKKHREQEVAQAPPPQPAPAAPVMQTPPPQPAPPPPPPQPVAKTVTIPAGTIVPVRITEGLSSQTAQPNQVFHGSLAGDLIADGMVAVPHGASVVGRVVDAKDATHFSGSSLLSIELTQINARGRQVPVVTEAYVRQGQGRGKNTAMKAGGGAALGAIIGALAGGGRGAAIGAAAGGATGAGVNAVTRGQQVQIQPETLINFKLQSPITVTTSQKAGEVRSFDDNTGPQLQERPQ